MPLNGYEYLEQIQKLDLLIKNKLGEYCQRKDTAFGLGGNSDFDKIAVMSSPNPHRGTDAIDRYIDLEIEIKALKKQLAEIYNTLEQLPADEYKVLYALYVKGYTLKMAAGDCKMSYEWAKKKKRAGVERIEALLDLRE